MDKLTVIIQGYEDKWRRYKKVGPFVVFVFFHGASLLLGIEGLKRGAYLQLGPLVLGVVKI